MSRNYQKLRKSAEVLSAICGGLLIGMPVFAQTPVTPQPNPSTRANPCPRIFYEEPHNSRVLVPQGCPPNALTQRLQAQGQLPANDTSINPSADQTRMGVGGDMPSGNASGVSPNPTIRQQAPYNGSQQMPTDSSAIPNTSGTATQQNSVNQTPLTGPQQSPIAMVSPTNGRVNIRLVNETGANVAYQVIGDTTQRSLRGQSDVILQGLRAPTTVTFQREDGGLLTVTPQASSETGILEVRLNETTDLAQDRKAMRIQENGAVFLN
ncbi:MAG: hypothetical protein KME32_03655 [Mojavia pulchra JT2-VF2]|jgi:hypothetical protein|uniref:Uncharacterized protein n=1 Tax=Mojavia pulchra JT2-VF2 TaxID=287848 RepID=A0A951PUN2_9NOST|nr:hypothetical protein [Mojavia pulchra JT2-VF2]